MRPKGFLPFLPEDNVFVWRLTRLAKEFSLVHSALNLENILRRKRLCRQPPLKMVPGAWSLGLGAIWGLELGAWSLEIGVWGLEPGA